MKFKIPWEELSGNKNLNGKYLVSFILDISEDDEISLTDIAHSITSGFQGHPVLNKISHLDLEKTDKNGVLYSQKKLELKAGDSVVINLPVELKSTIEAYEGKYIIGSKNSLAENLGEMIIKIPAGIKAKVNQVLENGIELIDFDSHILVPLEEIETNIIEDVKVHLNSIIFSDININSLMEDK